MVAVNKKTVAAAITTLAVFAVMGVGPISASSAVAKVSEMNAESNRQENYKRNLETVENVVLDAVSNFNEERSFDVYYGDIAKVRAVFAGVAGIEVKDETVVKPLEGFSDGGFVIAGVQPSAVRFTLVTSDPKSAISVIAKMELPVYELSWEAPNTLEVTFLTGGEV